MNPRKRMFSLMAIVSVIAACAEDPGDSGSPASRTDSGFIPVTAENYVQAETDWNFALQQGKTPINTWIHNDRVTEENQTIIRSNADVMYSLALVDISKGATLSIPGRPSGALPCSDKNIPLIRASLGIVINHLRRN